MPDHRIRLAAFAFLKQETDVHDDIVPDKTLLKGFTYEGHRVPLIAPQGIIKPAVLDLPLSFCTAPPKPGQPAPYHDELGPRRPPPLPLPGHRPTPPGQRRDEARRAGGGAADLPAGFVVAEYLPIWPVYVVGFDDDALRC